STFLRKSVALEVVQILAAASNVNGVRLRLIVMSPDLAAGTSQGAVHADTAAPTAPDDMTQRMLLQCQGAAGGVARPAILRDPFIPAGNGLWFTNSSANPVLVTVSYDVL